VNDRHVDFGYALIHDSQALGRVTGEVEDAPVYVGSGSFNTPSFCFRTFASERTVRREALNDEWGRVMLYAVSAKLIRDRTPEFHTRLTDGSIAA